MFFSVSRSVVLGVTTTSFDPISQKDYYRLQAFFTPLLPRDDLTLATPVDGTTISSGACLGGPRPTFWARSKPWTPYREKDGDGASRSFPRDAGDPRQAGT